MSEAVIRESELEFIQSMCSSEELKFPDIGDPFYFTVTFPLEADSCAECTLTFQLPERYPEQPLEVSVSCDQLSRDQGDLFRKALLAHLSELDEGAMQVYEAFMWAKEHGVEFVSKDEPESLPAAQPAEEEEEYTPPSKVTELDLMNSDTSEGQLFLQSLGSHWGFHNYETITTHPLWNLTPYSSVLQSNYKEDDVVWELSDPLVGALYLTKDALKTAGISIYCRALGWELERAFFDMTLPMDESAWDMSFEKDDKGLRGFTNKLKQKDLPELLRLGARKLQTKLLEEAGFDATADDDEDEEVLNTIDDSVKRDLAGQFDATRRFKIITYGRAVNGDGHGAAVVTNTKFNWSALGLTGRGKGLNTKKLDGRNTEVQGRTSRSDNFKEWMTEKINMVEDWFKDSENKGKLLTVAIYCSKGRHRSVSAAILLRDLIYPSAVCEGHGVVGGGLKVVKPKTK